MAESSSAVDLVGRSSVFLEVVTLIRRVSAHDVSVLLLGETGTGKEVAARAIHYLGTRRQRPFVPVNCGAIPEALVESELFGHCRGAFTDARSEHLGVVAQAEGGTLFLDEVDALSLKAQVALLRFLQDGTFRPLGAGGTRTSDVRIIAATNADLPMLTSNGSFRSDLLYRLMIMPIEMPPLRKRAGDAALLAEHFIHRLHQRYRRPPARMDPPSLRLLDEYAWPGNVRELENLIHREFLLGVDECLRLRADVLRPQIGERMAAEPTEHAAWPASFSAAKAIAVAEFERTFLRQALTDSSGNVSLAAQRAGKERRSFRRLLTKHGIDKRTYLSTDAETD